MRPNGETIRWLINHLPPHVFDEISWELPELLEMESWKCEFVHWYTYEKDGWTRQEVYNYWELDPDDPELLVMEFEDGILVLE